MKPLGWKEIYKEDFYSDNGPAHENRRKRHRHKARRESKEEILQELQYNPTEPTTRQCLVCGTIWDINQYDRCPKE